MKKVGRQQSKPRAQAKRQAQPKRSEAVSKRKAAKPAARTAAAPKKKPAAARPAAAKTAKVTKAAAAKSAKTAKTTKTTKTPKTAAKKAAPAKPSKAVRPAAAAKKAAKSVKQSVKTAKPKAPAKSKTAVKTKQSAAKSPAPAKKAAKAEVQATKSVQSAKKAPAARVERKPAPATPSVAAAPKPAAAAKTPANESKTTLSQTKKTSETAAKTAPAAAKPAAKPEPKRIDFKAGEHIVYPAHGVGEIVRLEVQEVAGIKLELYVISFLKDKMTLRVPVGKAAAVGMRKLADKATVEKALETVRGRARVKRTMWSRRAQEYEAKINSGDLISIAEVVRDLFRSDTQPEQSYSERQLYEAALDRMAREIAAVERLSETEAVTRIEQNLAKSPRRGPRSAENSDVPAEQAA